MINVFFRYIITTESRAHPYGALKETERKGTMTTRVIEIPETGLLKDFLYNAIYLPEGAEPPPREILNRPELRVYYDDFGSGRADRCIAALDGGRIVGLVWSRIMHDYGHIDDQTPSLAISVSEGYRERGIGTGLMEQMLELLCSLGYRKVSLAVQKANYAVKMYSKLGFETVDENEEEYIMLRMLQHADQKEDYGFLKQQ